MKIVSINKHIFDECSFFGYPWKLSNSKYAHRVSSMTSCHDLRNISSTHILLSFPWSRQLLTLFLSDVVRIRNSLDFVVSKLTLSLCFSLSCSVMFCMSWFHTSPFRVYLSHCFNFYIFISVSLLTKYAWIDLSFFIVLEIINFSWQ